MKILKIDTIGHIKGFVRHEDIFDFIKQKYDENAIDGVKKETYCPISECDWEYKINEHSEDKENWYAVYGYIYFTYNGKETRLFYSYDNLNDTENLEYYSSHGLKDMVLAETTYISLKYCESSVEIIKEIIIHFGGGWIDEDDSDDKLFYWVDAEKLS